MNNGAVNWNPINFLSIFYYIIQYYTLRIKSLPLKSQVHYLQICAFNATLTRLSTTTILSVQFTGIFFTS